jgi:hypothetical protein
LLKGSAICREDFEARRERETEREREALTEGEPLPFSFYQVFITFSFSFDRFLALSVLAGSINHELALGV